MIEVRLPAASGQTQEGSHRSWRVVLSDHPTAYYMDVHGGGQNVVQHFVEVSYSQN